MSASVLRSVEEVRPFGRLCCLPAGGRGNGLDKQLRDLLGSIRVHRAVDADDAAEG